jgi:hypothetical protein
MTSPEPGLHKTPTQAKEWGAGLGLFPIVATLIYYALPAQLQEQPLAQFAPQIVAYFALGFWAMHNHKFVSRLGLAKEKVRDGLRWGVLTGLLLGCLNTFVILSVYPHLGYDINFLKTTLHGRLPLLIMLPWFICGIALFVELNFRGFLLGRLAALELELWRSELAQRHSPLASCPYHQRADICIRSVHGEYFPATPLDRRLGRTDLGSDLDSHKKSLHHHRCACDRSHRDVQRGENGDRITNRLRRNYLWTLIHH